MLRTTVISLLLLLSSLTYADDYNELIKILRENGQITEEQYLRLLKKESNNASGTDPQVGQQSEQQIETKGGISVSTYDGRYSFELSGRLMLDAAFYSEDQVSLGEGTEPRRARLDVEGKVAESWSYELGLDFADGDVDIKDAVLIYTGHWPSKITIGHHKEPIGLEELTSSKYLTFMERALPLAMSPGRAIGVSYATYGNQWTFMGGLYGDDFDDDTDDEGNEGWGISGRVTYAPWHSDTGVLHLGASFSSREPDDESEFDIDSRPESHLTDVKYLNTDDLEDVDRINRYGVEFSWVNRPMSIQAEYLATEVFRQGADDFKAGGWYLYGSWFLTGESRNYKSKKGAFGKVKPYDSIGAWELALRFSNLDLNDAEITGGEADQMTLGLNWYPTSNTRFMFNYIRVENDANGDDAGDVTGSDEPEIYQVRAQLHF